MNKQNYKYRWHMLSFCIWIPMGNYYNYDIPTSLYNSFKTYLGSILSENEFEFYFGLLFSLTSFVNIFTPFISGKFRDNYGDRSTLFVLLILVSFGQFLFIEGFIRYNLYYIIIGRILISIGIEPCGAIQTSLLSQYFKIDHIVRFVFYKGFVVGLCELFASVGTISVMFLAPKLASQYGVIFAIQSGSFAIAMSFFCCIVTIFYDYNAEQYNRVEQQIEQENTTNQNYRFSTLYWLIIIYNMILFSTLLTFSNFSVGIMTERWYNNDENAEEKIGQMMGVMWGISSFLSPVFGYLLDKYKRRSIFNIFASTFAFFGLIQLWFYAPFMAINFLGISYAIMCASIWSSIVYLIDERNLGKGYAFLLSSCNLFLTILPLGISVIKIKTQSFFFSLILLASLLFLTIILAGIIYIIDKKEGHALDGLNGNHMYEIINQNDI